MLDVAFCHKLQERALQDRRWKDDHLIVVLAAEQILILIPTGGAAKTGLLLDRGIFAGVGGREQRGSLAGTDEHSIRALKRKKLGGGPRPLLRAKEGVGAGRGLWPTCVVLEVLMSVLCVPVRSYIVMEQALRVFRLIVMWSVRSRSAPIVFYWSQVGARFGSPGVSGTRGGERGAQRGLGRGERGRGEGKRTGGVENGGGAKVRFFAGTFAFHSPGHAVD